MSIPLTYHKTTDLLAGLTYQKMVWTTIACFEEENILALTAYGDSVGIPTIGAGFALNAEKTKDAVLDIIFTARTGLSAPELAAENKYRARVLNEVVNKPGGWPESLNKKGVTTSPLQKKLDEIALARSKDPAIKQNKRTTFAFKNATEVENLFNTKLFNFYNNNLTTALTAAGVSVPDSIERVVLFSLTYNGVLGPKLINALKTGRRAEAWFEIRYGSNGGDSRSGGIAGRRYIESAVFGLYNANPNATPQQNLQEVRDAIETLTRHRHEIVTYDQEFANPANPANKNYMAVAIQRVKNWNLGLEIPLPQPRKSEFTPAYLALTGFLGLNSNNIDEIWIVPRQIVNGVLSATEDKTFSGTQVRDLILGQDGDSVIAGGGGADILVGGKGKDTLFSGTTTSASGRDALIGGDVLNSTDGKVRDDRTRDYLIAGNSATVFNKADATVSTDAVLGNDDVFIQSGGTAHSIRLLTGPGQSKLLFPTAQNLQFLSLEDLAKGQMKFLPDSPLFDSTFYRTPTASKKNVTAYFPVAYDALTRVTYYHFREGTVLRWQQLDGTQATAYLRNANFSLQDGSEGEPLGYELYGQQVFGETANGQSTSKLVDGRKVAYGSDTFGTTLGSINVGWKTYYDKLVNTYVKPLLEPLRQKLLGTVPAVTSAPATYTLPGAQTDLLGEPLQNSSVATTSVSARTAAAPTTAAASAPVTGTDTTALDAMINRTVFNIVDALNTPWEDKNTGAAPVSPWSSDAARQQALDSLVLAAA
jgi:Ca2+-binding RTX toxin-like protein